MYLFDVALDISQSNYWRQLLFSSRYDKKFLISAETEGVPKSLKNILLGYNLQYFVSRVLDCPVEFDEGLVIFKFEAVDFPTVTRYSGNFVGMNILDFPLPKK